MVIIISKPSSITIYNEKYIPIKSFSTLQQTSSEFDLNLIENLIIRNCINIDIDIILKMKNLTILRIDNRRIKGNLDSISPFSKLPRLVELIISYNKITHVENLHHFKRLYSLFLNYDEIASIKTPSIPPDLESLYLDHNNISNIGDIYDTYWKGLVNVYLAHNYLHSFSVPEPLEYLEYIDLSDNYITSVKNLNKITHLHTLNLQRNPLPSDMIQNLRSTYPHVQIEYP